jgi:multiple sugar transport system substrate-binding protein
MKDAAWAFIKYSMATKEGQNGMFAAVDYFPGYIPAWDDPMYNEADPYFGGQKTRELWVNISKNVQVTFSTLMDATVEDILNNEVNSGLNQGWSSDKILEYVLKSIDEGTKQDYERNYDLLKGAGIIK